MIDINIYPDYELFVRILFVYFVWRGIVNMIVGIGCRERDNRTHFGIVETITGIIILSVMGYIIL